MKHFLLMILASTSLTFANAQYRSYDNEYEDERPGFKKENVFLGGAISLGFGSGSFAIGANPEVGYSIAKWLDAGLIFNINYYSQTYYDYLPGEDLKVTNFNYGGGVFTRIYPVPFLFLQLQPEYNWISYDDNYSSSKTYGAASFIGGIGYGQRIVGQGSYFFMIGLDLMTNKYSPYLDGYGHPYPIIRGGFDIYLKPSRKSTPSGPIL